MKIALTVHQFLPDHSSGTEVIAYGIAKELQARGHDVRIVTGYPARTALSDQERFDEYEFDGLRVVRFSHAHVPMGGQDNVNEAEYNNQLFYRFFKEWLRQEKPDVVHFVHLGRLTASAVDACVEAQVPTVFTATDFWIVCPTNQLRLPDGSMCSGPGVASANCVKHITLVSQPESVRRTVGHLPTLVVAAGVFASNRGWFGERWSTSYIRAISARIQFLRSRAKQIDRIVVPSKVMRSMLVANGIPAERMVTLPYGIGVDRIARNTNRGREEVLRVGFIGTLSEHKGAHVLIEAVKQIPGDVRIELKLHGRTDEFPDYISALGRQIGDDRRIQLNGPFRNTQIGEVLGSMDVLVCPSLWYENTPLVMYEAMAAGIPVVATDLAGMAESVEDGVNGLLFDVGDSSQLARHLLMLAEDRERLRALAAATRSPMSVPDHVSHLEGIYRELAPVRC